MSWQNRPVGSQAPPARLNVARGALTGCSDFEGDAPVTAVVRHQAAPAYDEVGAIFWKSIFPLPANRVGCVAGVSGVLEIESLSACH